MPIKPDPMSAIEAALALGSSRQRYWVFGAGACIAFFVVYSVWLPTDILLWPDSDEYLDFDPIRSAGYPAFLAFMGWLGLSLEAICRVQLAGYLIASLFLTREVFRTTGSVLPAAILSLLLWAAVPAIAYHFRILTESTFMSLQLVMVGFMVRALRDRDPLDFGLMAATLGIALAVRPSAIALVPMVPALWAICWPALAGRRWRALAFCIIGLAAAMAAERTYHASVHPDLPRTSVLGMLLYAKSAMIDVDHAWDPAEPSSLPPEQGALLQALEEDFAPVRDLVWGLEDRGDVRNHFLVLYEVYAAVRYRMPWRQALYEAGHCVTRWCSEVLLQPALMRLSQAPLAYLRLTSIHLIDLWSARTAYGAISPASARRIDQLMARHDAYPFGDRVGPAFERPRRSHPLVPMLQVAVQVTGIVLLVVVLWTLVVWLRTRECPRDLAIAMLCGLGVHGSVLFIALFSVAERRYLVVLWPLVACALLFLSMHLVALARPRLWRPSPVRP